MNYFADLRKKREKLDRIAEAYLDTLPFLSNEKIMERIYRKASEIFEQSGRDWENVPEWVADTMDGWMPFASIPENGSLNFALGFSMIAQDARLRNMLEIAEGREPENCMLKFSTIAYD
jgi:hypothetical protein